MRCRKRFAMGAGVFCLALAAGCHRQPLLFIGQEGAQEFAKDLAEAKRAGIPTTAAELQAPIPPPELNAAPLYTELEKTRKENPLSADDKILEYSAYHATPSDAQFERIRRALTRRSNLISLIHQAIARPQCIFVRDWKVPVSVLEPEYATMRSAARLLAAESLLMAHDGKSLEAARNQALGFRIAHHAMQDNELLGYLVGNSIDSITLVGIQKILYLSGDDPKVAEAVRSAVEKGFKTHSLRKALEFEAGCDTVTLEYMRSKGPETMADVYSYRVGESPPSLHMDTQTWSAFIDANSGLLLENIRRLIAVADTPYPVANPTFRAVKAEYEQDKDARHLLAETFAPVYFDTDEKRASTQAQAEVTRAGAFLLAWKAKHGAFPDTIDGVSMPKFVDPFDGKPLKYRREGAGFVVYSVGATGKFTGGAPDQKAGRETLFRYPAPLEFTAPLKEE